MLGVLQDGTLLDHKLNVHKLHLAHENRKLVNHNKIFSGCMISLHQL